MFWIRCRFSGVVAGFLDKVLVFRISCGSSGMEEVF